MHLTFWAILSLASLSALALNFDKKPLDLKSDGCTQKQRLLLSDSVDFAAGRVNHALQVSLDSTQGGAMTTADVKALRQRYFGDLSAVDDQFVTGESEEPYLQRTQKTHRRKHMIRARVYRRRGVYDLER